MPADLAFLVGGPGSLWLTLCIKQRAATAAICRQTSICRCAGSSYPDMYGWVPTSALPPPRSYMRMIECIEYTRLFDDGVQPHRWAEAQSPELSAPL